MKNWCKLCNMSCSMATINGYCQVTACTQMAEPMPICNNKNAVMSYETSKVNWVVDGYIPIEYIQKWNDNYIADTMRNGRTIINQMLADWEEENETNK